MRPRAGDFSLKGHAIKGGTKYGKTGRGGGESSARTRGLGKQSLIVCGSKSLSDCNLLMEGGGLDEGGFMGKGKKKVFLARSRLACAGPFSGKDREIST